MSRSYPRFSSMEEKRNIRKAFTYGVLTIGSIVIIFFFGLPVLVKFAGFIGDIAKSDKPIEIADTTPPAPPRFNSFPEETNQLYVDLSGSSEGGVDVILSLNRKEQTVLADSSGAFSVKFALNKGENTFSAKARDQAGNVSQPTETMKIIYDNDPPSLEISSPNDGAKFFGSRQKNLSINGKTEATAEVTINDRVVSVNDDGTFSFKTTLSEGDNTFTIKATDKAGNSSEKALTVNYSS